MFLSDLQLPLHFEDVLQLLFFLSQIQALVFGLVSDCEQLLLDIRQERVEVAGVFFLNCFMRPLIALEDHTVLAERRVAGTGLVNELVLGLSESFEVDVR